MTTVEPANVICQSWTNNTDNKMTTLAKQMTAIWDKSIFAPDKSPFIFKSVKIDRNEEISHGCFRGVKAIYPLSDQIG